MNVFELPACYEGGNIVAWRYVCKDFKLWNELKPEEVGG